ncbi:hypothetical protein OFDDKENP_00140 [Aeromonas phage B614]|nr:hypothetical protein OFDDKENP_00140 [Aeromonas phage B614]UYD58132.1 hypothetical protein JNEOFJEA_00035 [Aeromonas phage UP87]UYD58496.1 hypothetical protein IPAKJDPM_00153 [Aeromonas phage avDM14-QBC]UYD58712.1 hypothetical protein HNNIDBEH_00119 [Aeromonas phage avDM10-HWA]UYD58985.1 hypothetical protein OFOPOMKI_00135 [Aeromonas phage avDM7-IJDJ]UYD59797.1 hypothetical protein LEHPIFIF_00024 [Aeromonas phage avDM9-HANS]
MYVLIMTLYFGNFVTVNTVEFTGRHFCEEAAAAWVAEQPKTMDVNAVALCSRR